MHKNWFYQDNILSNNKVIKFFFGYVYKYLHSKIETKSYKQAIKMFEPQRKYIIFTFKSITTAASFNIVIIKDSSIKLKIKPMYILVPYAFSRNKISDKEFKLNSMNLPNGSR